MNKYEEIIEVLIALKDSHRSELSFPEIDALNQACNIIERVKDYES